MFNLQQSLAMPLEPEWLGIERATREMMEKIKELKKTCVNIRLTHP